MTSASLQATASTRCGPDAMRRRCDDAPMRCSDATASVRCTDGDATVQEPVAETGNGLRKLCSMCARFLQKVCKENHLSAESLEKATSVHESGLSMKKICKKYAKSMHFILNKRCKKCSNCTLQADAVQMSSIWGRSTWGCWRALD
jgi:hypothetical protein